MLILDLSWTIVHWMSPYRLESVPDRSTQFFTFWGWVDPSLKHTVTIEIQGSSIIFALFWVRGTFLKAHKPMGYVDSGPFMGYRSVDVPGYGSDIHGEDWAPG